MRAHRADLTRRAIAESPIRASSKMRSRCSGILREGMVKPLGALPAEPNFARHQELS